MHLYKKYFFAATLFLSAALLFQIQLIAAKMMLPKLGGAPAVWAAAMVFFQSMLLLGYGYAHQLTEKLRWINQALAHCFLIMAALVLLPSGVMGDMGGALNDNPIVFVLYLLAAYIGLPFLLLSTTTPLMQSWYGRIAPASDNPYILYAASNAGSFVGLLSYPFLVEPYFSLSQQISIWIYGFLALTAMMVIAVALVLRAQKNGGIELVRSSSKSAAPWQQKWRWFLYAFIPASMMLSVITHITTDIAAIPLVWVIVLAVYLLTFVLVFSDKLKLDLNTMGVGLLCIILLVLAVPFVSFFVNVWALVLLYLLLFFAAAMVFHASLAAIKPGAGQAAQYYMYVALGGAAASALNGIIAPVFFADVYEWPLILILAAWFMPRWPKIGFTIHDIALPVLVGAALYFLAFTGYTQIAPGMKKLLVMELCVGGIFLFFLYRWHGYRLRFVIGICAMMVVGNYVATHDDHVIAKTRGFFGVIKVARDELTQKNTLLNGTTIHGVQVFSANQETMPQTYYTPIGPLGSLMQTLAPELDQYPMAVAGLGAGSVACYAANNDDTGVWQTVDFFEIDPNVIEFARNENLFTYLKQCPANIIVGDARLNLSKEPDHKYGMIILDTFSSDAIPMHMLTEQSIALFAKKLIPGGVIAIHISNRYFNLEPVVAAIAEQQKMTAAIMTQRKKPELPDTNSPIAWTASRWMIVSADADKIDALLHQPEWRPAKSNSSSLWTDDYSSIWSVLQ